MHKTYRGLTAAPAGGYNFLIVTVKSVSLPAEFQSNQRTIQEKETILGAADRKPAVGSARAFRLRAVVALLHRKPTVGP